MADQQSADPDVAANTLLVKNLFAALTRATSVANQLPDAEEHPYHATFDSFNAATSKSAAALLKLIRASAARYWAKGRLGIRSKDDVLHHFDGATDVLARILEQADVLVDRHNGLDLAGGQIAVVPDSQVERNLLARQKASERMMSRQEDTSRPQLQFPDWPIDNTTAAFKCKLFYKPNAKVSLEESLAGKSTTEALPEAVRTHLRGLGPVSGGMMLPATDATIALVIAGRPTGESHPYLSEIRSLEYPAAALESCKEVLYCGLDKTPVTWIEEHEQLAELAEKLNQQSEIAVDLEAHSHRSYQGFCCLCQISTRQADYLIDTLACRGSMHLLNKPFTNPAVTKRDFGLYLVNLFDTGQASRVLEMPKFGLAYLLKEFCGVDADKKYQRADWRVRPIPAEMLKYAREDTHYLLYIYDRLRNLLLNRQPGLLRVVLERSEQLCLKQYQKPMISAKSHIDLLHRHSYSFNPQQMRVFAALFAWRDQVARQLDESIHYVLPNHTLFSIAETMPQTVVELVSCCTPCPLLVRQRAQEVVARVLEASCGASSVPESPAMTTAHPSSVPPAVNSLPAASTMPVTEPAAPPEQHLPRTEWGDVKASLSARQIDGASQPLTGSISWQTLGDNESATAAMKSKVQGVLKEIGQMTLLQVAAQTMAHETVKPKAGPVKPKNEAVKQAAATENEVPVEQPAQAEQNVEQWLQAERTKKAAPTLNQPNSAAQSMVERYGEVGKGLNLKPKKRKSSGNKKYTSSPSSKRSKAKARDEMAT